MRLFKIMSTAFDYFDNTVTVYLAKALTSLGIDYTHNQIFGVIYDGIKGICQNIMFYIEDALTEQNIFTAIRKKSIYSLARVSGYEPTYGYAATGILVGRTILNTTLDSSSTKIYIRNHTSVQNTFTNVRYVIELPSDYYIVDIANPLATHQFKIVQGIYNTMTYVAQGYALESVQISGLSLFDKDYITVTVDGEEYSAVGNLYDMTEDSKNYVINIGYDNLFDITFGNGVYGHRLTEGQTVIINYISHSGTSGNIFDSNTATFVFYDSGNDSQGNEIDLNNYITLSISNRISGGSDADTINNVRSMIGKSSKSLVLANEDNFKLFLNRFSFMGYNNVWAEKNSMTIQICALTNIINTVSSADAYFNLQLKDMYLDEYQKNMIKDTLENSNRTVAGINIEFVDPIIRQYAIICYVKIDDNYNKESAKTSISNLLVDYFINMKQNITFIPKSDLINKVTEGNENILSFDLTFISKYAEDAFYNGYYYKQELKYFNGQQQYVAVKYAYEDGIQPGLDAFGNIQIDTLTEIPVLKGKFNYYPNKPDRYTAINMDNIQFVFI